jgi:hypothetical protein
MFINNKTGRFEGNIFIYFDTKVKIEEVIKKYEE